MKKLTMYLKHGHAESGKNAGDFIGNFIATLFAVVLLFGAAAHAQPAATDGSGLPIVTGSLSLADAVSLGLADNLPLRGARADFDAAAAESRSAGAQTLPGISTTTFATAGDSSNIVGSAPNVSPQSLMSVSPHGSIAQTITLMAPIFTGGVLANRLRAAVLMSDAAKQDEQSSVLAITRSITDAYADAVYKQALVEVAASRLADEREQVRITQQSVDTGKSAPIDLLREQAELANANQMKTQADSDAALAILTLKSVLGISLLSDVTPTDSLDRLAQTAAGRDAPETQGDAIRLAEADRPEMDAAARQVDAARAAVGAARGEYAPQVYAIAMAADTAGDGVQARAGYTVGLAASVPLYDGGQRGADVDAAQARVRRAEADAMSVSQTVSLQAGSAWLAMQSAKAQLDSAIAGLAAAKQSYDLEVMRDSAGKSIEVERLDSLTALVRAKADMVSAQTMMVKSRADLNAAIGTR